jgi:hypothetical protein
MAEENAELIISAIKARCSSTELLKRMLEEENELDPAAQNEKLSRYRVKQSGRLRY